VIDLARASAFMESHARVLDRRRFHHLFGDGDPEAAVTALAAYANRDGGFGWAMEPDLRGSASQPVGALHAFEVLEEIAPATSAVAARLCDWLESVTLAAGGIPFALPGADGPGTAPWWAGASHSEPSLHITAAVCGIAHRVAAHDPAVAAHAWLEQATAYCLREIAALEGPRGAIEFQYVLQFLDALHDANAEAPGHLARLGASLPASGSMAVAGGAEGERIRAIDFSPRPGRPLRVLFTPASIAVDLDSLADGQRDDGGWDVDWRPFSPAAAVEWRGWMTVHALGVLRANGRLEG
jgi:hypothetical protein